MAGDPPAEAPTLLYLVKQVEQVIRARLDDVVRPAGLTTLQYTALTVLARTPDLTASRLARRSFAAPQSMADLVAALIERGFVERHRDQDDRRRLVLALTPAGRHVLERSRAPVAALEAQMLAGLTSAQRTELRRALLTCRGALAEHRAPE